MSVTTEILRIKGAKSDIRTLASQKNINIPSTTLIDAYASVLGQNWPDCTYGVTYDGDKVRGNTRKTLNQVILDDVPETTSNGMTYKILNGVIYYKGTPTTPGNLNIWFKMLVDIPAGTTVYRSWNGNYNGTMPFALGLDLERYRWTGINLKSEGSIATTYKSVYVNIQFSPNTTYEEGSWVRPMVILGTTAPLSYEPGFIGLKYAYYKGIKLGSCDYVDLLSNKLVIGGNEIDLGDFAYVTAFGSNQIKLYQTPIISDMKTASSAATVISNLFCGKYETVSGNAQFSGDAGDKCVAAWSTQQRFAFRDDSLQDATAFKNGNVGTKLYYELANPIEIQLP